MTIKTDRLLLRPFRLSDAADVFAYLAAARERGHRLSVDRHGAIRKRNVPESPLSSNPNR